MDFPILRYVDILIGLAVVMLLVCTVVAAVTQLISSLGVMRARHLRNGLQELLFEIDPVNLGPHARYIADRCLRHPMVGNRTTLGAILWRLQRIGSWILRSKPFADFAARHEKSKLLGVFGRWIKRNAMPLPYRNPADVIQREELILFLLNWASARSSFASEEQWLALDDASKAWLEKVRADIRMALASGGIADPDATAVAIRQKMMEHEIASREEAAGVARSRAVAEAAPAPFTGVVFGWFDNTMARVSNSYQLTAKMVTSAVALLVCLLIQLDSVALVKRLSQSDELRDSLVRQAEVEIKRYEQAEAELATELAPAQQDEQQRIKDAAERSRESIAASLATLREPKFAIIPEYLAFQKVAQTRVCNQRTAFAGTLAVGETTARIEVRPGPTVNFLSRLHSAIQASAAPVAVHWSDGCLRLVAKTADAARISLIGDNNVSLDDESQRRVDRDGIGFVIRLPGVLLSWILVSLGAPFWYDLLKKLVGFRSLLAKKDEDDRNLRQQQQQQTPPVAGGGGAAQTGAAPSRDTIAGGEDERGDLSATGAAG